MTEPSLEKKNVAEKGNLKTTVCMVTALVLIVAAVFARGIGTGFVDLDDNKYAYENAHVMGGLTGKNIQWAFEPEGETGFWIPLTYLSLELDGTLTGPERVPVAHPESRVQGALPPLPVATVFKMQNLFWHGVATVFLFLFVYRATGRREAAFWLALIWAIHPLRVESVAWVTERKDVLAGTFGFLAAYLYVGWAKNGGVWRYVATAAAFAMSLMSKPMCVTLPFALVLVDGWPLGRIKDWKDVGRRLGEKWLLILMSAGASVAAVITQRQANAVNVLENIPLGLRVENSIVGYVMYLARQVRVWDLTIYYPFNKQMPWWPAVFCGAILAIFTWGCVAQRRRRPWLLVGWLWFLGTLVPMIGLLLVGEQAYADRFSYFPAVGLMIMVVFTIADPLAQVSKEAKQGMVAAAVIFCATFSFMQLGHWKDSVTMLQWTVDHTENNFVIHNALANAYLREGMNAEAEASFMASAEENPTSEGSWMNIGEMHYQLQRYDLAAEEFYRAFRTNTRNELALRRYGESLFAMGRLEDAIQTLRVCLRAKPDDVRGAAALRAAEMVLARRMAATQAGPATQKH